MHGNFDSTQALNNGGHGVAVTGWVARDDKAAEPDSCKVTVEVTQTAGPGSAKAAGESGFYPKQKRDVRVPWTAPATTKNGDALHAGAANAHGCIKDPSDHTVFEWLAPVTLAN